MSPEVEAAIIAGSVGILTLLSTVATQFYGFRRTSRNTGETLKEQSDQLDRTLKEQREGLDRTLRQQRDQLDRTLTEQGKQLDRTLTEQRTRTLNERFATAADRLGSDRPPAVRLAGVYAMAGLADDWPENRQTCIDVLCAYLRLPYEPDPGDAADPTERLEFRANREVRHTVIRVITAHLREDAPWQGMNFDFTGVVFDGGDFRLATFSGGRVSFDGATFSSGKVSFFGAEFSGAVNFSGAEFSGGEVSFFGATFSGGAVGFGGATFSSGRVSFDDATFSGGIVGFDDATFSGGIVGFDGAKFTGGTVTFVRAKFSDGRVSFGGATFYKGHVSFFGAKFSSGAVGFVGATFSGGIVDLSQPADWSHPPEFGFESAVPSGVRLPAEDGGEP